MAPSPSFSIQPFLHHGTQVGIPILVAEVRLTVTPLQIDFFLPLRLGGLGSRFLKCNPVFSASFLFADGLMPFAWPGGSGLQRLPEARGRRLRAGGASQSDLLLELVHWRLC